MITVHGGGEISRTSSDVHDPLPIHALNGKVERSHRIDAEEFYRMLDGFVIHRPHGAQTPYERLKQKTQTQV
ncbi:hypothetical protein SUDANB1_03645 [Streptomyces sp. enrichment culture]